MVTSTRQADYRTQNSLREIQMNRTLVTLLLLLAAPAVRAQDDFTETPDLWTCGAQDWGPNEARCYPMTDRPAVGKSAMTLNFPQGYEHYLAFPKWRNANWDLSTTDALEFQVRMQKGTSFRGSPTVYLRNRDGAFLRYKPVGRGIELAGDGDAAWRTIRVPLKPTTDWDTVNWMDASLKHIDFIEIAFNGSGLPSGAAHHVMVDGVHFYPNQPAYTPPNAEAGDLDVLIIERDPKYNRYVLDYKPIPDGGGAEQSTCTNADARHNPLPGETVTFAATVQNKGHKALGGKFEWLMDSAVVSSGQVASLEPRAKSTFTWQWKWDPADHDLTFRVAPDGEDYCPRNDALTIRTNALMLKFMIEKGLIARMESKVNMLGSYSCEDWLQGQLQFMNRLFAASTYDFAPRGITQRVMVGAYEYVDDGYLPGLGEGPYRVGELDTRLDGGRGCTALDDPWNSGAGAPAFMNIIGRPDDAWLHELSHQIGVIDDYQFFVESEENHVNGVAYRFPRPGLMGGGDVSPHQTLGTLYGLYSPSNVMALNATKGKRRGYFGEYLYLIPAKCSLRLLDEKGVPLPKAGVQVYQTQDRKIDTTPEHTGRTDAQGLLPLRNRPAPHFTTETGITCHDNPFGPIYVVGFNGVFLVTAKSGGRDLYGFVSIMDFNRAYASGSKDAATIPVHMRVKADETKYEAPLFTP